MLLTINCVHICLVWRVQRKQLTLRALLLPVIGASLQVYPTAGLIDFTNSKILFITLIQNR
jgi:hypothetical protein